MKENILKVVINHSIENVFEFTTNPINTHKWIPFVLEEKTNEYPPKINTKYSNKSVGGGVWNEYSVVSFVKNSKFTLQNIRDNYFVEYSYRSLGENITELTYREWVIEGELKEPFTQSVLDNLKDNKIF